MNRMKQWLIEDGWMWDQSFVFMFCHVRWLERLNWRREWIKMFDTMQHQDTKFRVLFPSELSVVVVQLADRCWGLFRGREEVESSSKTSPTSLFSFFLLCVSSPLCNYTSCLEPVPLFSPLFCVPVLKWYSTNVLLSSSALFPHCVTPEHCVHAFYVWSYTCVFSLTASMLSRDV